MPAAEHEITLRKVQIMGFFDYTIDKGVPVPLYYQLKNTILSEIRSGNAKAGDLIPTEDQYCSHYGVSRTTVRQAIVELVNDGYLYRIKAKGTFVSAKVNRVETNLTSMYASWVESAGLVNRKARMVVDAIEIVASGEEEAKALQIEQGTKVIRILRYQKVDETSTSFIVSYVRYPLCDQTLAAEKFEVMSMYQILAERPESSIGHVERRIYAEPAGKYIAGKLGITKSDPILLVVNRGQSRQTGECIIFERVYYVSSLNKLVVDYDMDTVGI